jgi:hypothetical protein
LAGWDSTATKKAHAALEETLVFKLEEEKLIATAERMLAGNDS